MMRYHPDAPGNWGAMLGTEQIKTGSEVLTAADGCKLHLRSWRTDSQDVLLILHGLGAHGGWFIDMGNELARRGLTVYVMDHRGFGRSEGPAGHIDAYRTYLEDIAWVIAEIRRRHPEARLYLLGHSMGGIFAAHFASRYPAMLAGVLFLNPWIQDPTRLPLRTVLAIMVGGLFRSRRVWQVAGGHESMTTNAEAIQMLQEDTFWRRSLTASFLVQVLGMRLAMLKKAKEISIPALVMQAEADKAVIPAATRKFYDVLASSDKTWITYPDYCHDTEFEANRSQLDDDIVAWIQKHAG